VPLTAPADGALDLPAGATGTAWADGLVAEGAETLVGYDHPHLGRWAAVTTHAHGAGRVTYVGTLPDRTLAVALGRWLQPAPDPWADRPDSVTVTGARSPAGGRLRFVSNWSWEPARLRVPEPVRDLLLGIDIGRAQQLDLEPWSARVLVEEARSEHNEGGSTP
jgi:beta-galactosidase